jgi:hypothetical protein
VRKYLFAAPVLVATLVVFASPAGAGPKESQNLRGMAGRSFVVSVTDVGGNIPVFTNCYRFNADGSWYDQVLVQVFHGPLGMWEQHRNGANTPYTAEVDFGGGVVMVQTGMVTPRGGTGVLQLTATTVVPPGLLGSGEVTLYAVGSEAESCPAL